MHSMIELYMKSAAKKNWFQYIKQFLYLLPIISISLVMSSTQNIKYINQKEFLDGLSYETIEVSDEEKKEANTFQVYDGTLAVVKDVRGVSVYQQQYGCEVYNLQEVNYNFEDSYFAKKNMNGSSISELGENEVIISYDVAKRLKVHKGDRITFISTETEDQMTVLVKGIMKTKYAYEQIGAKGTVLMHSSKNKELSKMYGQPTYHTFTKQQGGTIRRTEELEECDYFALSTKAVVMANVIFPCCGVLLILLVLNREIKMRIKKERYNFSVLISMGLEQKAIMIQLMITEGLIFLVASTGALLLYKYLFIQKMLGQYVSIKLMFKYLAVISLLGIACIYGNVRLLQKKIRHLDLVENLCRKGEIA